MDRKGFGSPTFMLDKEDKVQIGLHKKQLMQRGLNIPEMEIIPFARKRPRPKDWDYDDDPPPKKEHKAGIQESSISTYTESEDCEPSTDPEKLDFPPELLPKDWATSHAWK